MLPPPDGGPVEAPIWSARAGETPDTPPLNSGGPLKQTLALPLAACQTSSGYRSEHMVRVPVGGSRTRLSERVVRDLLQLPSIIWIVPSPVAPIGSESGRNPNDIVRRHGHILTVKQPAWTSGHG